MEPIFGTLKPQPPLTRWWNWSNLVKIIKIWDPETTVTAPKSLMKLVHFGQKTQFLDLLIKTPVSICLSADTLAENDQNLWQTDKQTDIVQNLAANVNSASRNYWAIEESQKVRYWNPSILAHIYKKYHFIWRLPVELERLKKVRIARTSLRSIQTSLKTLSNSIWARR